MPSIKTLPVPTQTLPLLHRPSFFAVSGRMEYASCEVELWGYPAESWRRLPWQSTPDGLPKIRPELIFDRGYVRRRILRELPISMYRGRCRELLTR
jgi:hypothetical protein